MKSLKEAFKPHFLVGAALEPGVFHGRDEATSRLVVEQFNAVSPENALKWSLLQPTEGVFTFDDADAFVQFGVRHEMNIHGHVLVWHNQVPQWVFRDKKGQRASRDLLLDRMRAHISTVVRRYKGRIACWDVVNEAIDDDGTLRNSEWLQIIGEDYIEKAFEYAHEADPQAHLSYNDYNIVIGKKHERVLRLVADLKKKGVPIDTVCEQGHWRLDWPAAAEIEKGIDEIAATGVNVMITELDIDILPPAWDHRHKDLSKDAALKAQLDPYAAGLPDEMQAKLAGRYAELFALFVRRKTVLSNVTFWGETDRHSWLNAWPVKGRTNYPLLFDRSGKPKPAFFAALKTAQ
jgi:endo-1,4-beta-xylanase